MIHAEIINLFNYVVEFNEFVQKKMKEVNGYFGIKKAKSINDLRIYINWNGQDELFAKTIKLSRKLDNAKFDFPICLNVSDWKKLKEIDKDNPRADLQIISYEANELVKKIKNNIEIINDNKFISKVKNMIKKLKELDPWKTQEKSA
jgi:hypothetical protein